MTRYNKTWVVALALASTFFGAAAVTEAAGRDLWIGKDVDNASVTWSCSNTAGDNWVLKRNGTVVLEYVTVASNADYIELQAKGIREFERVRLTRDKLLVNKQGSQFKWLEMASGKWSE